MRMLPVFFLLSFFNTANAVGMTPIPPNTGICVGKEDDAFCYEWALASNTRVRLVAFGYEDGIDYIFYELKHGAYKPSRYTEVPPPR